ncbi:N-methyl-L-tryptophan oxidase [Neobacillus terrae]|uniref:N-methyl-L-tryptophan oxidase n=1 Tax=Neobacillus terrae TaxID=3034837 RepID=UPI00140CF595|nr:N-methyl-L-tryptophan oxidase [Neobacillus terrae]NHM33067.1 N-methyl-L-tryptophan oxidase [Neobacillus terrae]
MKENYEVVIVGAGSMGMAAGYYISKLGINTLLLDRNNPPHENGSHHGETRIIRHAYGEGSVYVPLALRAQKLWKELEEESGINLFASTGVLSAGPPNSSFIEGVIKSAKEHSLPIEVLSSEEIRENWAGFTLPEEYIGCIERSSGVLFSESCIRAFKKLAQLHGAIIKPYTIVKNIELCSSGAVITTNENTYYADAVVISAGAWAQKFLSNLGKGTMLQPVRKTVSWFECDRRQFSAKAFPAFTVDCLHSHYYGFPDFNGKGIKVGRHDGGEKIDPDKKIMPYGFYPKDEGDVRSFLKKFIPLGNGRLLKGSTCFYTLTKDEDFIIDRDMQFPNAIIAAGFSGHGFKFSSVIGEIIADLIVKGKTNHDLSAFKIDR